MPKHRDLSPLELEALRDFASYNGRSWKDKLASVYWYNARPWTGANGSRQDFGPALHGLRNDLGPDWLNRFKLPKL